MLSNFLLIVALQSQNLAYRYILSPFTTNKHLFYVVNIQKDNLYPAYAADNTKDTITSIEITFIYLLNFLSAIFPPTFFLCVIISLKLGKLQNYY